MHIPPNISTRWQSPVCNYGAAHTDLRSQNKRATVDGNLFQIVLTSHHIQPAGTPRSSLLQRGGCEDVVLCLIADALNQGIVFYLLN